jgi:acetyl-CoA carboxylase biotin carboxyl carrier protein
MSLQDKIKKIINVIENTNIEEIEISSFWGVQKIRLSKKASVHRTTSSTKPNLSDDKETSKDNDVILEDSPKENKPENNESTENPIENDVQEEQEVNNPPVVPDEDLEYQKAPLVGTFYASSKPGEPAFVNVGDEISKGQVLCVIEAMKIFNEIESEFDGVVVEILAEDSNPVEFNQSIFSIKPSE